MKRLLRALESAETVIVPVMATSVSTLTVQPDHGRTMACGWPLAATTLTTAACAMVGKMSSLQKSKAHAVAAVCVSDRVAREPAASEVKLLSAMSEPLTETTVPVVAGMEKMLPASAHDEGESEKRGGQLAAG